MRDNDAVGNGHSFFDLKGDLSMKTLSLQRAAMVLFLSLGLTGGALAHPESDAPAKIERDGGRGHRAGFRGFGRLHDELKLDDKQEALWKEAQDARRESGKAIRERSRKHHDEIKALLDQPNANARAILKRMDEFRGETQKLYLEERERLLKVYDALSAEQKEKVRVFFKESFDRKGGAGRHGKRGKGPSHLEGRGSRKN
jgi:Spy/CpxP family protein refolding chaperone